jgi:hypothetical protein
MPRILNFVGIGARALLVFSIGAGHYAVNLPQVWG